MLLAFVVEYDISGLIIRFTFLLVFIFLSNLRHNDALLAFYVCVCACVYLFCKKHKYFLYVDYLTRNSSSPLTSLSSSFITYLSIRYIFASSSIMFITFNYCVIYNVMGLHQKQYNPLIHLHSSSSNYFLIQTAITAH